MQKQEWAQPWRGLFGLVVTLVVALGITAAFEMGSFQGLISVWAMSIIPILAVISFAWGNRFPAEKLENPWRGLALLSFAFIIGTFALLMATRFVGGRAISAILVTFIIISIITTFFLVIAFDCWPFHKLSLPGRGLLTFVLAYLVAYLIFRLISFSDFMRGFPLGLPRLTMPPMPGPIAFAAHGGPLAILMQANPGGPIAWESALAFCFWMFVFLFCFVHLGFWPFSKVKGQPLMGILVVISCFILALASYAVGVWVMGLERIYFLVAGVFYAFGMLLLLLLFQTWPGRVWKQPAGGFVNLLVAVPIAIIAFYGYRAFASMNFGAVNMVYPENYFAIAYMVLALTFPCWVVYAGFFDFWPLPPMPVSMGSRQE
jgi:hypothetical protein